MKQDVYQLSQRVCVLCLLCLVPWPVTPVLAEGFILAERSFQDLEQAGISEATLHQLRRIQSERYYSQEVFENAVSETIGGALTPEQKELITLHSIRFHETQQDFAKAFGLENTNKRRNLLVDETISSSIIGDVEYEELLRDSIAQVRIFFEFDKSSIKDEKERKKLQELAATLGSESAKKIQLLEIAGHTDNIGTEKYNDVLSDRRTQTVFNVLNNLGLDMTRLNSRGYGEKHPVDTNDTPKGRANNRRVEFFWIK